MFEYPTVQTSDTTQNNMLKLQKIQNAATRFITNNSLRNRIRCEELHQEAKLEPVNVRLNKLKIKILNKIHDTYMPSNDLYPVSINYASDFSISDPPRKNRKISVAKRIINNIFIDRNQCPWNKPPSLENYASPPALFRP